MSDPPNSHAPTGSGSPVDERFGRVPEDDRVRDVSLPLRLYASKHVHRLIPAPLALAIAASVGPALRQRRNPAELADAEGFLRDLLLYTPRATEAEALAKEWLREKSRVRELFWRPWLLKRSRIHGLEHWETAQSGATGCLIVFGHFGPTWAVPQILQSRGLRHFLVASSHYWKAMPPGYEGLATLYRRRQYGEKFYGKSHLLPSDARPGRLLELLEQGESIAIAFDVPGWASTPFLGRSLALSGGPATLALRTGAPILPALPARHGSRVDVTLLPPLDPVGYPDPKTLRTAIAQVFETFVVSRPEWVELAWNPSPLVSGIPPETSMVEAERVS